MREIIKLIIKYHFTIIFIILEVLCVSLIISYNSYQKVIFSRHASVFLSSFSHIATEIHNYFRLSEINKELVNENIDLKNQLEHYRYMEETLFAGEFIKDSVHFEYVGAKVVNMTFNRMKNYISLNVGANNGVEREMAVVAKNGVVGLIKEVDRNFSIVIPLINIGSHVSAKIKRNSYIGSIEWDGSDYRYSYLKDIPYHVNVTQGDTIVTSGYSSIFPEGIVIGFVDSSKRDGANFLSIKVRLGVDFKSLSNVYAIRSSRSAEQRELEKLDYE